MGYSVGYQKISGYYDGTEYVFLFPDSIKPVDREKVEQILYDSSRYLLGKNCATDSQLGDNVYFFIFMEGAVLFRIGMLTDEECNSAAMVGLFFPEEYVPTAWFLLDALAGLIRSKGYEDLDDIGPISEAEVLELACPDHRLTGIKQKDPRSFALFVINPHIENVVFYPLSSEPVKSSAEIMLDGLAAADDRKYASLSATGLLDDVYIERFQEPAKRKLFVKRKPHTTWVMKAGAGMNNNVVMQMYSLEAGNPVTLSSLLNKAQKLTYSKT